MKLSHNQYMHSDHGNSQMFLYSLINRIKILDNLSSTPIDAGKPLNLTETIKHYFALFALFIITFFLVRIYTELTEMLYISNGNVLQFGLGLFCFCTTHIYFMA